MVQRRIASVTAVAAFAASAAFAQIVLPAKSGLVHYFEGDVSVNGEALLDRPGTFADMKKSGVLTTEMGRAEVLLTPGVFLRVGERSEVKMLNTSLADTRVELLSGQAMVESDTPMKDNLVSVVYKDYTVVFRKHGLYGFSTDPAELKVYSGEAEVSTAGGASVMVKEGRLMPFAASLASERFDSKSGDSLFRWSRNRSEYVSIANVSAARTAHDNGFVSSGIGNWFYNDSYGMYTYLPGGRGTFMSPFGFSFFSPYSVYSSYYPTYYGGGSNESSSGKPVTTRSTLLSNANATPSRSSPGPSASGVGAVSTGGGAGHAGGKGH